jgi:hypothetical protein
MNILGLRLSIAHDGGVARHFRLLPLLAQDFRRHTFEGPSIRRGPIMQSIFARPVISGPEEAERANILRLVILGTVFTTFSIVTRIMISQRAATAIKDADGNFAVRDRSYSIDDGASYLCGRCTLAWREHVLHHCVDGRLVARRKARNGCRGAIATAILR